MIVVISAQSKLSELAKISLHLQHIDNLKKHHMLITILLLAAMIISFIIFFKAIDFFEHI